MCKVYTREKSEPLEKKLAAFCETNDIKLNQNTDIVRTGKRLGFDIFKLPLDDEQLDGVILCEDGDKIIGVNDSLDMQDSRFVVAHEIAHYISEKADAINGKVPLFARRDKILHGEEKSATENDMDYMAAAMLVPKDIFIEDLKVFNVNFGELKDHQESTVIEKVNSKIINYLAILYNVKVQVIVRRIAELSYYMAS